MDPQMQLMMLKSEAYDLIATRDQLSALLAQKNQQIIDLATAIRQPQQVETHAGPPEPMPSWAKEEDEEENSNHAYAPV